MKITVVFDSLEEFQQYVHTSTVKVQEEPGEADLRKDAQILAARGGFALTDEKKKALREAIHKAAQEAAQEPAPAPEVPFEEDKPKEYKDPGTGAIRGATPEEQRQIEAEEKAATQPEVKVETVRKLLADLNKKAGKNVAKDLIKEIGYKKLTDVPADKLPLLQETAEGVMAKYA